MHLAVRGRPAAATAGPPSAGWRLTVAPGRGVPRQPGRSSTPQADFQHRRPRLRLDLLPDDRVPRPPRDRRAGLHGRGGRRPSPGASRAPADDDRRGVRATTGTSSTWCGWPCSPRSTCCGEGRLTDRPPPPAVRGARPCSVAARRSRRSAASRPTRPGSEGDDDAAGGRGPRAVPDRVLELPRPDGEGVDRARRRRPRPVARERRRGRRLLLPVDRADAAGQQRGAAAAARSPPTTTSEIAALVGLRRPRSATGPQLPDVDIDDADLADGRRAVPGQLPGLPQRLGRRRRAQLRAGRAPPVRRRRPLQVGAAVRGRARARCRCSAPTSSPTSELDDLAALRRVPPGPRGPRRPRRSAAPGRSPRASWPGSSGSAALLALVAWIGTRSADPPSDRPTSAPDEPIERRPRRRRRRPRRRARPRRGARGERSSRRAVLRRGDARRRRRSPSCTGRAASRRSRACCWPSPSAASASASCCGPSTSCPTTRSTRSATPLASTEEEVAAFTADFEAGESHAAQPPACWWPRPAGPCAALGVALLFPIRSLGPRPGQRAEGDRRTAAAAIRVVTRTATPVRPRRPRRRRRHHRVPRGPHRRRRRADAADPLPRRPGVQAPRRAGRTGRSTASSPTPSCAPTSGCPVGLYQAEEGLLLCPCHQSTFDVLDGARAGLRPRRPAAAAAAARRSTTTGYIVATGDFSGPVGPGFWDRGR